MKQPVSLDMTAPRYIAAAGNLAHEETGAGCTVMFRNENVSLMIWIPVLNLLNPMLHHGVFIFL